MSALFYLVVASITIVVWFGFITARNRWVNQSARQQSNRFQAIEISVTIVLAAIIILSVILSRFIH